MLFLYIDKKTLLSHPLNIQQILSEIQVEFLERIVLLIVGLLVKVGENINDFKHWILKQIFTQKTLSELGDLNLIIEWIQQQNQVNIGDIDII